MQSIERTVSDYLHDLPATFDRAAFYAVYEQAYAETQGLSARVREPGYRLQHGHRVAKLGWQLLNSQELAAIARPPECGQVVWLGGLLHDVVKDGLGQDPPGEDHAEQARRYVVKVLPAFFPAALVEQVAQAVYLHNKRQFDSTLAAKLVQDADLIDHFGSLEIWLASYVAAGRNETLADCLQFLHSEGNQRWRNFAVKSAHFATTRRALQERITTADRVIKRLQQEQAGQLELAKL